MASIDKTYITEYSQYRLIADWCKEQGSVIDSFGNTIVPYDYIPHILEYDENYSIIDKGEWTEEYFNSLLIKTKFSDICLWSTPLVFDIFLIRNCPIDFIQERLKDQYGDEYYQIKNETSIYDIFERNGIHKPKFKIKNEYLTNHRKKDIRWVIEIDFEHQSLEYDDVEDKWYFDMECHLPHNRDTHWYCDNLKGDMSVGRIKRLLKKWNLPSKSIITFNGIVNGEYVSVFSVNIL